MKNTALLFFGLLILLLSGCDKEKKIMRKQSGVWEIRKWQGITYSNGVITKDTTVENMGYIALWNNDLNGFNEAHYNLTYSPDCWATIANNATGLDRMDDVCYWESDTYSPDRFALESSGGLGEVIMMMFTISKSRGDKQEWTFIRTGNGSASSMDAKDVFTLERVKK